MLQKIKTSSIFVFTDFADYDFTPAFEVDAEVKSRFDKDGFIVVR